MEQYHHRDFISITKLTDWLEIINTWKEPQVRLARIDDVDNFSALAIESTKNFSSFQSENEKLTRSQSRKENQSWDLVDSNNYLIPEALHQKDEEHISNNVDKTLSKPTADNPLHSQNEPLINNVDTTSHTTDTPTYSCPICAKSFNRSQKLRAHVVSLHSKRDKEAEHDYDSGTDEDVNESDEDANESDDSFSLEDEVRKTSNWGEMKRMDLKINIPNSTTNKQLKLAKNRQVDNLVHPHYRRKFISSLLKSATMHRHPASYIQSATHGPLPNYIQSGTHGLAANEEKLSIVERHGQFELFKPGPELVCIKVESESDDNDMENLENSESTSNDSTHIVNGAKPCFQQDHGNSEPCSQDHNMINPPSTKENTYTKAVINDDKTNEENRSKPSELSNDTQVDELNRVQSNSLQNDKEMNSDVSDEIEDVDNDTTDPTYVETDDTEIDSDYEDVNRNEHIQTSPYFKYATRYNKQIPDEIKAYIDAKTTKKITNNEGAFTLDCNTCYRTFKSYEHFLIHLHGNLKRDVTALDEEIAIAKKFSIAQFKCKFCKEKEYLSEASLKHHETYCDGNTEVCRNCYRFTSDNQDEMKAHRKNIRNSNYACKGETRNKCYGCNRIFTQTEDARYHHTFCNPTHICTFCQEIMPLKFLLPHLRKCNKRGNFKIKEQSCPTCKKVFPSKIMDHLKKCMLIPSRRNQKKLDDVRTCEYCGMVINQRKGEKTANLNRRFKCHLLSAHGIADYSCDICGRKCLTKERLVQHMMIHTGEKPFKCDLCGMKFRTRSSHDQHMLFHKNEREYACEKCGATFNSYSPLLRHMVIHSGKRDYKCDICDKTFTQAPALKRHKQNVHEKIKAFKCEQCDISYSQKYPHTVHMKEKHGIESTRKLKNKRDNYTRRITSKGTNKPTRKRKHVQSDTDSDTTTTTSTNDNDNDDDVVDENE